MKTKLRPKTLEQLDLELNFARTNFFEAIRLNRPNLRAYHRAYTCASDNYYGRGVRR